MAAEAHFVAQKCDGRLQLFGTSVVGEIATVDDGARQTGLGGAEVIYHWGHCFFASRRESKAYVLRKSAARRYSSGCYTTLAYRINKRRSVGGSPVYARSSQFCFDHPSTARKSTIRRRISVVIAVILVWQSALSRIACAAAGTFGARPFTCSSFW